MAEPHVEDDPSSDQIQINKKRKIENTVLDTFRKLSNGHENTRIKAGIEILRHLTQMKTRENGAQETKYVLKRLIRGLGSSEVLTKTGYFTCLVGLLDFAEITVEDVFESITEELHKSGKNSKSENADVCSGQIFAAGAIIRSSLYKKCTEKDKIKIIEVVVKAGKERTYLTLAAYEFIVNLYETINRKEFKNVVFPLIKEELCKAWSDQNLDSLYLLVETQKKYPGVITSEFLNTNLGTAEIVSNDSIPQICDTLTNIPRVTALKHPIFEIVTKAITEANLILPFFEELDNKLSRSNRNRFFLITTLLNNILPNLEDVTIIPNLFTKNYLQQLINTYKTNVGRSKDKEFQVITQKLFETLLNTLKQDHVKDKLKIKVIKRLLFYPGTFIFEKVTKSKLIQNITGCLKNEGVRKLGTIYREVVLATKDKVMNENTSERWWNMDRVYASHLLVKLINHPAIQEDKEWKIEQLLFLMQLGLLTHDFENVGIELADSLKYTFYSALDLKLNKLDDLRFILTSIVRELDNSVSEDNSKLRLPLTTEGFAKWKHTISLMDSIGHKKKKKYVVFHILFLQLNLQIFNNSKLATESLDELYSCYERVHKKKNDNDDDNNTNDPLWIEVIIDLFLNLLSHNSHLLRNIVNCVFPLLCKYLNGTAIHQILSVLDPKNESNPLSRFDDESDSDDDNENDDDDEEEEEEKESESDSDETADEEESNTNDKLRLALHKALGSKVDDDAESVDLDDLDDDEGEKLDEALGQAFKQFKPNLGKQKKQSKDDQTLTHFRVRVLDLIEIYINSTPPMLLSLEIMLPLLQVLEFCIRDNHQKPLQDRVKACLKKLCSLKKFSDFEGITEDVLVSLLQSLLEKGTRNALIIQDIGEKVADSCIFIINCSQIANLENSEKRINQVIVKGLCDFFKRRDCLIPYVLFKNIVQLSWKGILDLVPLLADFIFDQTVRPFRRTQAAELVRIFYNNHRFFSTHSKIKALKKQTTKFLENYLNFFKEFNSNPAEKKIKEKFLSHLFLLLSSIKTCPVENNTFEDWQSLGEAIRECRSQISFSKDTKVAFNKLCKHLNVSNIVQLKQTTLKLNSIEEDESEQKSNKNINGTVPGGKKKLKNKAKASHDDTNPVGEENGLNSKKQKRKKNANINNLKMKKESKALRLESLSEGFGKRKIAWQDMDALEGEATHAKKNKI